MNVAHDKKKMASAHAHFLTMTALTYSLRDAKMVGITAAIIKAAMYVYCRCVHGVLISAVTPKGGGIAPGYDVD